MGAMSRGVKNAFRNGVRSASVILILSIAIGMSLVMLMSLKAVEGKISDVKGSIGNFITVSPAGIRGFEGGGELLSSDNISKIAGIDGVTKTIQTISDRLTGTNTNLVSSVEAGNFGRRQRSTSLGNTNQSPNNSSNFAMPVMAMGTNDLSITSNLNFSKFEITSGEQMDASASDNIAMVGTALAAKNNLSVGQSFQAYGNDISVVGIFDSGNEFANGQVVFPLQTLQTLSGQANQIGSVLVQLKSIDQIEGVQTQVKDLLGTSADVTSGQDTSKEALTPLENIKTITLYSLVGSLIAGAIILFLTMVMIVRERRREIGVLKAIGASNVLVTTQFVIESLVLTLMSSVIGIIVGTFLSNPVLKVLISNNSSSSAGFASGGGGRGEVMRMGAGLLEGAGGAVRNLTTNVGLDIILYGIGVAIIIAIIGSAIPAFIIAKIRPAEVMRSE